MIRDARRRQIEAFPGEHRGEGHSGIAPQARPCGDVDDRAEPDEGEIAHPAIFAALEKLQYDLYYIKNSNLLFDIAILAQTLEVVVMGKGAR